jgi:hypothetical protein
MGEVVTYSSFPTLVPKASDKAVGAVATDNYAYCRPCIERLGKNWNEMKYIPNSRARKYILNCHECGWRITEKRAKGI